MGLLLTACLLLLQAIIGDEISTAKFDRRFGFGGKSRTAANADAARAVFFSGHRMLIDVQLGKQTNGHR